MKLTRRQASELYYLETHPGLWKAVEPYNSDYDLMFYLAHALVEHIGTNRGYRITDAGRAALKEARNVE